MSVSNDSTADVDPGRLIDPAWRGRRIAVAMSGGVDSSVTAALCSLAGCEVVGLTMKLWDYDGVGGDTKRDGRCCTVEAFDRSRAVAAQYGFPHYTVDFRERFARSVIGNFVDEYRRGRTPNPCVICNVEIKWGAFWEKARAFGCEAVATGHYARIDRDAADRIRLRRGIDRSRDQSYFLWGLEAGLLERTLFPLGGLTKDRVRTLAKQFGLASAETAESRDICFVDDGNLRRFLSDRLRQDGVPPTPGPIRDAGGKEIGRHAGITSYTIGQRRGLGVAVGKPQYVTGIDARTATLRIGDDAELYRRRCRVTSVHWHVSPPHDSLDILVQIRYRHAAAPATVTPCDATSVEIEFADPQRAITPGQSAVFYDGDSLLGGGLIASVGPE